MFKISVLGKKFGGFCRIFRRLMVQYFQTKTRTFIDSFIVMADSKSKMRQNKNALVALICCAVLFFACILPCFGAGAMNIDYMEPQKWAHNPAVQRVRIDYTNYSVEPPCTLKGDFYYLTDGNLCLYTYFKITESSLDSGDNVFVTYDIHAPDEEYTLTLGRDGFEKDSPQQERSLFKVKTNFETAGKYISAVQYTGKSFEKCRVDVTLIVNGRVYCITGNKEIFGKAIDMEILTTEKASRPNPEKPGKKKKKKHKNAPKKKHKKKAKKEKATKFHPNYNITTTEKAKQKAEAKTENEISENESETQLYSESETHEYLGNTEGETKMSGFAKWILLAAAVIGGIGIGVIITTLMQKKDKEETDSE